MFLSREINIKLCQNFTETYIWKILYKIQNTDQIQEIRNQSENNPRGARETQVCFYYYLNLKSFQYYIIALPLERVLVTWYGRISYISTFWYNFDTVLYQFLETGTSDRCLICIVQLLRFLGFSLYLLLFFLKSPFKCTVQ